VTAPALLMSPAAFASRVVGAPWQRWACSWSSMDCFGLVVLYFREVLGVDLGQVPQTDIASGFTASSGWVECGPEPGATAWMAWRDGAPTHCGVLLPDGKLLHSEGTPERPGRVRVSRLAAVAQFYGDDIRFYRYAPTC
jgi:cell wall-associated NlpC family hydrolase